MLIALGSLLLAGLVLAVATGWLCSRPEPLARMIGLSLAVLIVSFCAFTAFALLEDDIETRWKIAGLLLALSFSVVGIAEGISAYRGLKAHAAASTRIVRR